MSKPPTGKPVVILGLGGGGRKLLHAAVPLCSPDWIEFIAADTEQDEAEFVEGVLHLPLGREWTHGLSCGGDPLVGQRATSASINEIRDLIRGCRMLMVVGCLGGGTATGGVQVLASLAREERKLCIFFVTLPFATEGNGRREVATQGLEALRQRSDLVIAVQNDLLFVHFPADTPVEEAFTAANRFLAEGLLGIAELVRCKGLLPIDFASLRVLLKDRDAYCALGIGRASGSNRLTAVVEDLLRSPMLGGKEMVQQAGAVVATLVGGPELPIGDLSQCLQALNAQLSPNSRTIVGASIVPEMAGQLRLTLLAIHYQQRPREDAAAAAGASRPARRDRQAELFPDERASVGIFGDTTPTMCQAQNLDIPTFRRLGLVLDAEE